ncbi:MAG: class I SAM-dependent DNA methyltransferase [Phycisphaerae bacterium]
MSEALQALHMIPPKNRRRDWGQVFTPRPVADWMVRWACAGRPHRILDPALGGSVFVDAMEAFYDGRNGPDTQMVDVFEIDADLLSDFQMSVRSIKVHCRHADFITATIRGDYDAIVANPPYVRHHEMDYPDSVLRRYDRLCTRRLSRMTNLYALFLVRIWNLLAPGGRAAVITPAEWLNADFGRTVKSYLIEENAIEAILHFDHSAQVFDDALTTAAITLLRRGRGSRTAVTLARVSDVESLRGMDLKQGIRIARQDLDPAQKWTPLFSETLAASGRLRRKNGPTLGTIAHCNRGIATGANGFFTLNESDRRRHGLDLRDLSPCITKAKQVSGDKLTTAGMRRLVASDQRVYLLNPRPRLTTAVKRYLAEGERLGIHKRYLPSHRSVWYRPEQRLPAPIWVSVFARGMFRFVRNTAGVLNLTAYHGITLLDPNPRRVRTLFEYLCGPEARNALRQHTRIYADGLLKVEPRDVLALLIPTELVRICRP